MQFLKVRRVLLGSGFLTRSSVRVASDRDGSGLTFYKSRKFFSEDLYVILCNRVVLDRIGLENLRPDEKPTSWVKIEGNVTFFWPNSCRNLFLFFLRGVEVFAASDFQIQNLWNFSKKYHLPI